MEAKKILEAILEDKLVSVCNLAHLLGTFDLIFNSFITIVKYLCAFAALLVRSVLIEQFVTCAAAEHIQFILLSLVKR